MHSLQGSSNPRQTRGLPHLSRERDRWENTRRCRREAVPYARVGLLSDRHSRARTTSPRTTSATSHHVRMGRLRSLGLSGALAFRLSSPALPDRAGRDEAMRAPSSRLRRRRPAARVIRRARVRRAARAGGSASASASKRPARLAPRRAARGRAPRRVANASRRATGDGFSRSSLARGVRDARRLRAFSSTHETNAIFNRPRRASAALTAAPSPLFSERCSAVATPVTPYTRAR